MTENFEDAQLPLHLPLQPPEIFEKQPLNPQMDGEPVPPKLSFSEEMSQLGKKFSFGSFTECTDLPGYKNVTAGVGVNLPFPGKTTKVTAGVEARTSVFAAPKGAEMTKGVVPSLRVTQDLGKNAKLIARVSPAGSEYAKIGVQFNF